MSLQPRVYTGHQQIGGQKNSHFLHLKKITDLTNVFEDKEKLIVPSRTGKIYEM